MGWASGSSLAEDVWKAVRDAIGSKKARRDIAREIIDLFEGRDCDTLCEAEQLVKDAGQDWFDSR